MHSERDPLLGTQRVQASNSLEDDGGEGFDNVPKEKRQLGFLSAVSLIINRIIGTGIYATPSVILKTSGSVGVSLIMWILGASIAAAGTAVFMELGTGLPRNGGEKNYLEFIYRRPAFLTTCVYSVYGIIMGTAAANSLVFGEYALHAFNIEPTSFNTRSVAFLSLTFILLVHGIWIPLGVRLQNALGLFKFIILSAIAISGLLSLAGFPGLAVRKEYDQPNNFRWDNFWEGGRKDANSFVSGLYNVIWSFTGYSGANYALSEIRNPVKTIKRAAPLAVFSATVVYMLINVGYFAVVSKADILGSKRIVAALFFRNLFGETTERALSAFIALSTLGNLLVSQFTMGRVVQELGREGLLPLSAFFASNKPFNAPLAGLFTLFIVSCAQITLPPPGDAYLFTLTLQSYSGALINLGVSLGLLLLYTPAYRSWNWDPPFRAHSAVVVVFFISNVFLVAVPFIPPASDSRTYETLPYWSHLVAAFGLSLVGLAYWYCKVVWIPRRRGYKLRREWVPQDDGVSRYVFRKEALE
ncbi:hypothetical protein V5O48_008937 [Marasmius crinis-equi]|uniref:Amino acid transporter n=1 Tax=Marasmius crinis-equi TaxID=585013 RepID=A0ABR3FCI5_9AGAR